MTKSVWKFRLDMCIYIYACVNILYIFVFLFIYYIYIDVCMYESVQELNPGFINILAIYSNWATLETDYISFLG